MKQSLVIGASGLVGEHLVKTLRALGEPSLATYRTTPTPAAEQLDICRPGEVDTFFERFQPAVVFLPAALTNVDYCELNQELSYATNVIGVKNIVKASNRIGARLIYFSTDYIFDGVSGPYGEEAIANPISEYGRQKLSAEHHIALASCNYLIVRTTVVYGWERQGKNFVYRLVKSLKAGVPIRVPTDQVGTPTYAPDLAEAAIQLSKMDVEGVVNVAGQDCLSRYEFALQVAKIFNMPEHIVRPVLTKELGQPAKRPLMAGLRTEKAMALLGTFYSSSNEGLLSMLKHSN